MKRLIPESLRLTMEEFPAKYDIDMTCGPPVGILWDGQASILYRCTLTRDGNTLETPYHLGIGYVKWPAVVSVLWTLDEEKILYAKMFRPLVKFTHKEDRQAEADIAAKLAKQQKVAPHSDGVLDSLAMSMRSVCDGESFEDWAGNLGYDTDSRKAEATYNACMEEGRNLLGFLGLDLAKILLECEPL